MCGLVGIAGDINKNEKDAFKTLLVVDTLRGPHSTGVASVKTNGDWELAKKKGNAWDLFDSREYSSMLVGTSYALIGHNRYATKGKINNINAHPFEFTDVVGAHNGTIRGQHRLPDHYRFEVDSENIYHAIQKEGLEETLSKLDGAYALSYWDKRSEELILLRNNERTLFYCFSENLKTVFWASEMWMLYAALGRADIKFKQPKEVPQCTIMRFKFERKINAGPVELTTQEFEEFIPPKPTYNTGASYGGQSSAKKTTPLLPKSSEASTSGGSEGKVKPGSIINNRVDFTVDGTSRNVYGQAYISCSLWADPSCEVRVYAPEGGALWLDMLAGVDETFSGVVSSYTNASGEYTYNIKLSTVELVIEEDDDSDPPFDKAKKADCAWCSSPVADDKGVVWVDGNTAVCSGCQDVDEVKQYLELAS